MSNAARAGRRRRFLHEGSTESFNRSSSQSQSNDAKANEAATGNRYAHRASSASFAMAKRLLPQTWVSLVSVMLGLIGATAMLVAIDRYGFRLLSADSLFASETMQFGATATLSAWFASTLWLAIAGVSLVLFGVRRQRMDDLRCQYRWWLVAAMFSLFMSLNASINGHLLMANCLAKVVGWSPLPGNAFWWFMPAALICGGLAVRLILDLTESRLALTAAVLAMLTISFGWSVEAGFMPNSLAEGSPLLASPIFGPAVSLVGTSLLLLTALFYSRHIVLEEGGVIARPVSKPLPKKSAITSKATTSKSGNADSAVATNQPRSESPSPSVPMEQREASAKLSSATPTRAERRAEEKRQRQAKANSGVSEPTIWVSGDDSNYQDEYEEQGASRKLSKAERKRLRKQKARHAA